MCTRDCRASQCSYAGCAAAPQHNGSNLQTTASQLVNQPPDSPGGHGAEQGGLCKLQRPAAQQQPHKRQGQLPAHAPQQLLAALHRRLAAQACKRGCRGSNMLTFMRAIQHGLRCTAALPLRCGGGLSSADAFSSRRAGVVLAPSVSKGRQRPRAAGLHSTSSANCPSRVESPPSARPLPAHPQPLPQGQLLVGPAPRPAQMAAWPPPRLTGRRAPPPPPPPAAAQAPR